MNTDAKSAAPAKNAAWAELLQLVPIVSLALPFIVRGSVDLGQAASGFVVAAALTLPIAAVVRLRGQLQNPILVGTALWLWAGALAFRVPLPALQSWLTHTQAFGLFVGALVAGAVAAVASPYGLLACQGAEPAWQRRASLGLLALCVGALGWAWAFRTNIRLGGGLPFIVLNVARRAACLRAPVRAQ